MAERIEQYLDEVGAQVRWKRVRPALTQELRTHLEEQAEAYRAEGLPAAEAEAEAVRQMGDAEQIGRALDAVLRPKRQTVILSLAGICILLGAIFRILSQDSPKLFTLAALVLTAGLLLGGYLPLQPPACVIAQIHGAAVQPCLYLPVFHCVQLVDVLYRPQKYALSDVHGVAFPL